MTTELNGMHYHDGLTTRDAQWDGEISRDILRGISDSSLTLALAVERSGSANALATERNGAANSLATEKIGAANALATEKIGAANALAIEKVAAGGVLESAKQSFQTNSLIDRNFNASSMAAALNASQAAAYAAACCCELKELIRSEGDRGRDLQRSIQADNQAVALADAKNEILALRLNGRKIS